MESSSRSMVRPGTEVLPDHARVMFEQGVGLVLQKWTALQLAVQNEWGGSSSQQKATQFHSDIVGWITQTGGPLYIDELESMLDDSMITLFNTETEDGSLEEVANKLMSLYVECMEGNFATIQSLLNSANASSSALSSKQEDDANDDSTLQVETGADMELDYMSNNVNEPGPVTGKDQATAIEEADGWTLVSLKSKPRARRSN